MKKILFLVIFIQSMDLLYASSEPLLNNKHHKLKKKFNLSLFISLPPDMKRYVADFFEPNSEEFKKDLTTLYYTYNYPLSDKLVTNLADEFFYNHTLKHIANQYSHYDTTIVRPLTQQPSKLSKIIVSTDWTVLNIAILQNNIDLVSKAIDIGAKSGRDDPLDMAIVLEKKAAIIQLLR